LSVAVSTAFAQNPPRIVLVPLENRAGTQFSYDIGTLDELLANFINEAQRLNVIDRLTLNNAMAARHWKTENWSDISKTAEMGRALKAQYIMRGTVSRLGDTLLVSVRILDIATSELRTSTNTQLEHMNEAYSKMNSMAEILTLNLGLPVQQVQPELPSSSETPKYSRRYNK
jgi:TolB-like protein